MSLSTTNVKAQSGTYRILVFHFDTGWPFSHWYAKALRNLGHEVFEANIPGPKELLVTGLLEFKPDFAITEWAHALQIQPREISEMIEEAFTELNIPILCIYLDHLFAWGSADLTERLLNRNAFPTAHFLFLEDQHTEDAKRLGLKALTLTPSIDDALALQSPREFINTKWATDLSFVGSVKFSSSRLGVYNRAKTIETLEKFAFQAFQAQAAQGQNQLYWKYLFNRVRGIHGRMAALMRGSLCDAVTYRKKALAELTKSKDAPFDATAASRERKSFENLIIYLRYSDAYSYLSNFETISALEGLKIRLFGSPLWHQIFPTLDSGILSLTRDELLSVYASSKVSLQLVKYQFTQVLPERFLTCLAAGGFPLTAYRSDLIKYFEGQELPLFRSEEEAKDRAAFYLKNDEAREKIISELRPLVLRDHTASVRWKKLIETMEREWGFSSRT